jgi:flagellar hook-basal body complex protein FliE
MDRRKNVLIWESKFERTLKEMIEKAKQEQIESLERSNNFWQKYAMENYHKYIELLIKQS